MVEVNYSADIEHIDEPIYAAEAERPGQPIRIRMQPSIFRKAPGETGQHRAWLDVSWTLECANAAEVIALREALRVFFEQVAERGPDTIKALLLEEPA